MFRHYNFQRIVSCVVLITFSSLTLYPCAVSAQVHAASYRIKSNVALGGISTKLFSLTSSSNTTTTIKTSSSEERLSQLLKQIQDEVKAVAPAASTVTSTTTSTPAKTSLLALTATASNNTDLVNQHVSTIRSANSQIKALYSDINQSFKDTEQHLKDAKLSSEILARHSKAVALYQSRQAEFDKIMERVGQADDKRQTSDRQAALADLSSFMDKYPNAKPHQYTDPNKLPFGSPSNKARKPNESKAQYQASLFPPKYDKVMLAGQIPDGLKLAQATLPDVPTAQDIAETEDVQLTPAIKAQAAALNNNPVQIYNWVRNNISFIPSYGSIQGSELTLQNKRGNAFDTASLLIALYRAAGTPARYVYGTIDVPADKVMNWVGGVTKIEAAQSLLGQGGIPNIGLASGGKISTIRMEHVWVEAFVDYTPSRGAVNKNPNTWVPMDASFKQYDFTAGMDIKNKVLVNSQNLMTQLQQGATVNEAGGYVQNLNQTNLQTQMNSYQIQVQNYINSQKVNATVGDVLGTQKIKTEIYDILLGSLPYRVVTTGSEFQTLPDNLRWKFKTNLYPADGISTSDTPVIELNRSTPQLAGKKITLSFVPATQADQDLINSYLPKAHADGSPIQPGELPTSLPGYLLNMKAEFRVEGQVVATSANSFTMGSSVRQANQYFNPSTGAWDGGDDNDITVGEYDSIGLDLQGVGGQQVSDFRVKMEGAKAALLKYQQNQSDASTISGMTKEDITGNILQAGMLGYFAQVDVSDKLTARMGGNIVTYRQPSYGRFFVSAEPNNFYGVVRSVSFPGVVMDVDYLRYHTVAKDFNPLAIFQFMRHAGADASVAESAVPEVLFRNPNLAINDPMQPKGFSAVKILNIAATLGQKVYLLNKNNKALHNSILQNLQIGQDVKLEITNALATGKEVTVHETNISSNGWTGSGYIIMDPVTGAGAYKISGGANGGFTALDKIGFACLLIAITALIIALSAILIEVVVILSVGGEAFLAADAAGAAIIGEGWANEYFVARWLTGALSAEGLGAAGAQGTGAYITNCLGESLVMLGYTPQEVLALLGALAGGSAGSLFP
ncbi:transglutaminase-like domain-containing protein [Undibacterium sp. TS12]|uniref:transglutaminase-like domain-containing protein n=1 Tax=Undibacterium sp. TS12 TaxID=2908202 RepID=UPI001F4C5C29|nr:transglutaminase-like domain-containing protein [Undibacterium sp. TS12]MCH8619957.1 transglutaminase-like domain-containing protein [Undibacterium sp. TS12]